MVEKGIEIIFKKNKYTWFCRQWDESIEKESSYNSESESEGVKAKDWVDPVDEVFEDGDRLIINSGARIYSYLLNEVESYSFYNI